MTKTIWGLVLVAGILLALVSIAAAGNSEEGPWKLIGGAGFIAGVVMFFAGAMKFSRS